MYPYGNLQEKWEPIESKEIQKINSTYTKLNYRERVECEEACGTGSVTMFLMSRGVRVYTQFILVFLFLFFRIYSFFLVKRRGMNLLGPWRITDRFTPYNMPSHVAVSGTQYPGIIEGRSGVRREHTLSKIVKKKVQANPSGVASPSQAYDKAKILKSGQSWHE